MRARSLATALAAASFSIATAAAPPPKALELRTLGIAQLENERPAEAEATFRTLSSLLPSDPLPAANLAVALLRTQKYDAALTAIDAAIRLASQAQDAKRSDLLLTRAEVLKWSGKVEDALREYERAATLAPESLEAQFRLYRHATTVKTPAAEAAASTALGRLARLRPDNLVILLRSGADAIARGDRAVASQAFLRVRELIWQAPPMAGDALAKVLEALEGGDVAAARVPALRLENVLKVTPAFQQGQRELTTEIQGVPLLHLEGEPAAKAFGAGTPVKLSAQSLDTAATEGRALAVGDFDGDTKPDVARVSAGKLEVRRAAGGWKAAAGPSLEATQLAVVDLDNDGALDLIAAGPRLTWLRGKGDGTFSDATATAGLSGPAGAIAAIDFDIEGDLDLAVAGGAGGLELYRNALTGPLEAVGNKVFPALPANKVSSLVASDLDRDGDLDLLLAGDKGITWLDNLRQGKFRDRTRESGLAAGGAIRALAAADLDNDGWPELITLGAKLELWRNRGGRFEPWKVAPTVLSAAMLETVLAVDLDNDGRLDLVVGGGGGVFAFVQREGFRFEALERPSPLDGVTALAASDLDGDGDLDLVTAGSRGLHRVTNDGGNRNRWLAVRLKGLNTGNSKNNLFGLGSTVEVRAGDAYQFREVSGDVTHLGLGAVAKPDSLRIVWTNGVPQNRLQPEGNQTVVEEQLLKGSCPFLYTWDGERIAFVTDLLWGAPLGLPVAEGAYAYSDPQELVAIPQARPRDGVYDLRITEELWEAAYFDRVRLWVVDAPAESETASSLRIVPGETVPEAVHATREVRPLATAWDGRGREVTARVAQRDELYADGYSPSPYQGVSPEWSFTFDLGAAPNGPVRLLLDGWIFPADASLNLAVAQRRDLPYMAPRLEVETAHGWQVLMPSMGHPAGKTKTMVVDTPPLPHGARRLRIVTSLWLHWDRIAWSQNPDDGAARVVARLTPTTARLTVRGFSASDRRAPNAPHAADYDRLETAPRWLPFAGRYTRLGEVRELLTDADDRLVILAAGDELALRFDASDLPAPPAGMQRQVFLESLGWDKDADRNTFEAQTVEPLPFRAMSAYPYGAGETYPVSSELERYRSEWLTREIQAQKPVQGAAGAGSE